MMKIMATTVKTNAEKDRDFLTFPLQDDDDDDRGLMMTNEEKVEFCQIQIEAFHSSDVHHQGAVGPTCKCFKQTIKTVSTSEILFHHILYVQRYHNNFFIFNDTMCNEK